MEMNKRMLPMDKETRARVVAENDELKDKVKKLEEFIISPTYLDLSLKSQNLLFRQLFFMREYSGVLSQRILLDDKERKVIADGNE